jgi:Ca2+/Na+ antiporter
VQVNTVGLVAARIGIPEALLGITFLAWGNSMGDFINNTSLAKRGLSSM